MIERASSCFDHSRDVLAAMILQEERFYSFPNYFLRGSEGERVLYALNVVESLAMLVTDVGDPPPVSVKEDSSYRYMENLPKVTSCSSLVSITGDLYGSSQHAPPQVGKSSIPRTCSSAELSRLRSWRHQMIDWAWGVVENLQLDANVVAVGIRNLDRYLAHALERGNHTVVSRDAFQLHGMVCLYLAIKTASSHVELTIETLVDMAHGIYTEKDISEAEFDILSSLDWHINPPTVMDYCTLYLNMFPHELPSKVEEDCQYFADASLDDEFFVGKAHSLIALAATIIATNKSASSKTLESLLSIMQDVVIVRDEDFGPILRRLECFR